MPKFDFNKEAEQYDNYYNTDFGIKVDAVEKRIVQKHLEKIGEREALEIGCGTGHWTMFFSDRGFQITAIDLAEEMLKKAIDKNIPGAVFTQMDAENLMFGNESVKNIFTIATAEFTDNKQKFFDEAYRVLKRNGYFLIGALNENSPMGKNKSQDHVFKNAEFFTYDSLKKYLNRFGHADIDGCVLIDERGQILDYPEEHEIPAEKLNREGAFFVATVKKL
jgi:ubiquinone/menaquinone biosynthesis C-methylase UbiE